MTTTADVKGRIGAVVRAALGSALVAVVLLPTLQTRADVDLWGHLRFGLDILENGRIDRIDPYSFTSDRAWINHEWLSEVAFATAWRLGGSAGLIVLKLACIAGATLTAVAIARARRLQIAAILTFAAATLVAIFPRTTLVRPQIFSVLFFALLLWLCEWSERHGWRRLFWAVPLVGLWANLHGGWIVGLATLSVWSAGLAWAMRADRARAWFVLVVPIAAAAATLVNPYGAGLWAFLLETVRLGREGITEWGPIWSNPARTLVWAVMTMSVVVALARLRPTNLARLAIPALWGLATLKVNRLDAFFSMSVLMLLLPRLAELLLRPPERPASPHLVPVHVLTAVVVLALALAMPGARRALTCIEVTPSWWPEPDASALASSRAFAGRMVTFFNWGEYAIWHLPRTVRISFDGRRETVYSNTVIEGHLELYAGTPRGMEYLRTLDARYIWFPSDLPVMGQLIADGWTPVFTGPRSTILERGAPVREGVAAANETDGPPPCFPGRAETPNDNR